MVPGSLFCFHAACGRKRRTAVGNSVRARAASEPRRREETSLSLAAERSEIDVRPRTSSRHAVGASSTSGRKAVGLDWRDLPLAASSSLETSAALGASAEGVEDEQQRNGHSQNPEQDVSDSTAFRLDVHFDPPFFCSKLEPKRGEFHPAVWWILVVPTPDDRAAAPPESSGMRVA